MLCYVMHSIHLMIEEKLLRDENYILILKYLKEILPEELFRGSIDFKLIHLIRTVQ